MSDLVVVLEEGGQWPEWLLHADDGSSGPIALRQRPVETSSDFAARVALELKRNKRVVETIFACSDRVDAAALVARHTIATAIFTCLSSGNGGRLLLTENHEQTGHSRAALSALGADLAEEWEGSGVSVSVLFGQAPRAPRSSRSGFTASLENSAFR
jgi:hypothetical protein